MNLSRVTSFFSSGSFGIPPAVFILLVTVFSFGWFLGYEAYQGDQLTYFPDVLKKFDPGLFSRDILFGPGGFTLFDEFVATAVRFSGFDIFYVLFFFSLAMRFVYFYSIYRIALYFTENKVASLLAPLLFLSGFVIYGTGMRTIAPMLLPKYMAIALCLLGLSWLLERRILWSALAFGVGFLFHPSSPIPFLAIFYTYILLEGRAVFSLRTLISAAIPPLFLLPVYFFMPSGEGAGIFAVIDEAWRQVILRRDSYYLISTWYYPNSAPIYLAASIFLFFLVRKDLAFIFEDARKRRFLFLFFFVPLGLGLLSLFFADFLGLAFITQLSLGRGLMLWKFFFNGLFVYYALRYIASKPRDFLYNFLLLGVIIAFVVNEKVAPVFLPALVFIWTTRVVSWPRFQALISFFRGPTVAFCIFAVAAPLVSYFAFIHENDDFFAALKMVVPLAAAGAVLGLSASIRNFVSRQSLSLVTAVLLLGAAAVPTRLSIYPSASTEAAFIETCDWIKSNTKKSALFIPEPFSSHGGEMRLLCGRGLFATRRDGGQVVFNREYALEWNRRYDIIKRLEFKYDRNFLLEMAEKYGIDYLLSDSALDLENKVFDNASFYIYKLR